MESQTQKQQVFHNRGFYYFTFIMPTVLISSAVIAYYLKTKQFPYLEDIGMNIPEKRFVETAFNVCAWIMITALLTTDGIIQSRNHRLKIIKYGNSHHKNDFKFSFFRFLTCISAALTFISCIAYGSILTSDSLKYHYICSCIFLISTTFYFTFLNVMFIIVKMNNNKEVTLKDKSSINVFDWIHGFIAPVCFIISFRFKQHYFNVLNGEFDEIISKSLQFIGLELLFANFVRILLRMPVPNIYLEFKKEN